MDGHMRENQIKHIQPGAFEGLHSLILLRLGSNKIAHLNGAVFKDAIKLEHLALDNNQIKTIASDSFSGLFNLGYLTLKENTITTIEEGAFNDTKSLYSLILSNNKIRSLQTGVFDGLPNLMSLSLTLNNITTISPGAFRGLTSLISLYLNENNIRSISLGVFEGLSSLQYCYLDRNPIELIEDGALSDVRAIQYMNLGHCNITFVTPDLFKGVTSLRRVLVEFNNITTIKNGTFRNLKDLYSLSLMGNKIEVIESEAFKGLHSLKYLFLDLNRLTSFQSGVFNETTSLIHLAVEYNRIESFPAIQGISTLEHLYLNNNKVKVLKKNWFKGLKNLQSLEMARNQIEDIEPHVFKELRALESVNLDRNNISYLDVEMFSGSPSLIVLSLGNNRITTLQLGLFKGLSSLRRLDLSTNQLKEIRNSHFKGLSSLAVLLLGHNEITNVSKEAFQETKTLESISLWKNRLTSIPNGTFQGVVQLQHIILQDNELSLIPDCSGAQVKQLTLSRNPIKVLEEGAFLSLPSLETVNLLDTEMLVPVKIWPMAVNVTYFVSRAIESTFTIELVQAGYQNYARVFLSSLGYICVWGSLRTTCKPCNRGTFKSKVKDVCEVCPAGGFYQDEMAYVGAMSYGLGCKQCPPGTYVKPEMVPGRSQTDCQSCPQGTNFKQVAKFRACKCLKNYYRLDRFGPCTSCTKGYVCDKENINLEAGFFWVWESRKDQETYETFKKDLGMENSNYKVRAFEGVTPKAYACPLAESCLGGISSKCAAGYTGPLCSVCEKGHFNMMAKCRKCPSPSWIIGQIVLTLLALGFIIFIILWEKKKRANDSSRSLTDIFLARLKIVIGFYQVSSSTFGSFSYINWPGPIITMMRYAKMVQLNLLQIVPLHCLNDKITINAYSYFLMSTIMTAVVIAFGFLANLFLNHYKTANPSRRQDKDELKMRQYREKCYRCVFLILFITFPSTCSEIIKMLPVACHIICSGDGINCKSYLRADYSVECNTAKHDIYGALSIAGLTYCIGFPVFIILVLKRGRLMESYNKKSLTNSVVIFNGLRFLYENYSPSCWFWEVVELVRKIIFSSLLILLNAESRTSLGMASIASGWYSILFALHKPINDGFEHWLQLTSLLVTSVNFTIGMLMKIPQEATSSGLSNEGDSLIVTVLLVGANVAVIIIIVVKYATTIIQALLNLKKEPKCNVLCCLEILQVVGDAHADMSGVCTQPSITEDRLKANGTQVPALDIVSKAEYTNFGNEQKVLKGNDDVFKNVVPR